MNTTMRWFGAAVLFVFGGFALTAPALPPGVLPLNNPVVMPAPINQDFLAAPGLTLGQGAYNTAVLGRATAAVPPYVFGFHSFPHLNGIPSGPSRPPAGPPAMLTTNPYASNALSATYGSGSSSYRKDPTAGFLHGASDAIRETDDYYQNVLTARDNYRRALLNEWTHCYEPMLTPEQLRRQQLERDLAGGPYRPPIADILSGKSLNDLLHQLQADPNRAKGPNIPVDDKVLSHINVTSPEQPTASVGLLKNDGKLDWPTVLASKEFEQPRTDLTRKLADAAGDLKVGKSVGAANVKDLKTDIDQMRNLVEKADVSVTDYIAAKSYLDQVNAAILALQDPKVAAYFNHKFNAKNVAELEDDMKGLDFAPAAPGDEEAYKRLYQALAAYDKALQQPVSPTPPRQP